MKRTQKRMAAWLAMLAVAMHTFWPVLAQAAPAARLLLLPMCAMDGVVHEVEVPLGNSPLDDRAKFKHCKLCTVGVERLSAAPPGFVAVVPAASTSVPAPAFQAPPPADPLDHPFARPRAPPSVS